jgi:hypothetical protein
VSAEDWAVQRRHEQERRELLARDLHDKYMTAGMPKAVSDRLFEFAWEHGHSAGTHEVEMFYADAKDIVNAAFKAGKRKPVTYGHDFGFECAEFDEDGSCIHSDHMQAAGL